MKITNTLLVTFLLIMAGCVGHKQSGAFITVDVTASYPKKELILQDFMNVEYIALETTGEFLCEGFVQAIGNKMILAKNNIRDGNIFIYDRNGKGLRKINRMGRGGEEYMSITNIVLDEDNGEIFVNDDVQVKRILVYDLFGKFKRTISHQEGALYDRMYNYDNDHLICHNRLVDNSRTFSIISKKDGSTTNDMQIAVDKGKEYITIIIVQQNGKFMMNVGLFYNSMISCQNRWIFAEHSSDTVYQYHPNGSMSPFIVRIPSIQSMSPEVFLFPGVLADEYYFMQKFKRGNDEGYSTTELVYDRFEKAIYESTVYNDSYTNKSQVSMMPSSFMQEIGNTEVAFWRKIEAYQLIESFEKGLLTGTLKEIAAKLKEDDNPVIMLVKNKK